MCDKGDVEQHRCYWQESLETALGVLWIFFFEHHLLEGRALVNMSTVCYSLNIITSLQFRCNVTNSFFTYKRFWNVIFKSDIQSPWINP